MTLEVILSGEAGAVPSRGASGGALRGLRGNHYLDRSLLAAERKHARRGGENFRAFFQGGVTWTTY